MRILPFLQNYPSATIGWLLLGRKGLRLEGDTWRLPETIIPSSGCGVPYWIHCHRIAGEWTFKYAGTD
jgi:hypothetical protein